VAAVESIFIEKIRGEGTRFNTKLPETGRVRIATQDSRRSKIVLSTLKRIKLI